MSNRNTSGCCRSQGVANADEAATTKQEKSGCGCEGEGRKAEARGSEAVIAQTVNADTTKTERKQGCCC